MAGWWEFSWFSIDLKVWWTSSKNKWNKKDRKRGWNYELQEVPHPCLLHMTWQEHVCKNFSAWHCPMMRWQTSGTNHIRMYTASNFPTPSPPIEPPNISVKPWQTFRVWHTHIFNLLLWLKMKLLALLAWKGQELESWCNTQTDAVWLTLMTSIVTINLSDNRLVALTKAQHTMQQFHSRTNSFLALVDMRAQSASSRPPVFITYHFSRQFFMFGWKRLCWIKQIAG